LPEEDQPGHGNVVILGHAFWQSHFGSDPGIVGKDIELNGKGYTVVGVMDSDFRMPTWAEVWTPLAWTDKEKAVRGEHHYMAIARLKDGVALQQAQAEMDAISHALEQQYPEDDKGWGAVVVPLRKEMVGDLRPALLVLLGAVGFVLLIACANVANLVLAKTLARRKEIAIRTALGADRGQIMAQVLTETILLALAGGVFGLVIAHFAMELIVAFLGDQLPHSVNVNLDFWVLGFTLLASLVTGLVSGLVPGWRLTKPNLNDALKEGLGRTDSDAGGNRTRNVLVVAEISLSLLLLVGAGLMIRTLWSLQKVDSGIDARNVLTMSVSVAATKYSSPAPEAAFFKQVLENVRELAAQR
jgi:predicted permease